MSKNLFRSLFLSIICLAAILRLPGLDQRYLLASDTGRDILVARGAVALGQLPWVGSFSSAGPFVFGPNWYWFLMIPAILTPGFFLAPWVLILLVSLFFVFVMGLIGRVLGGRVLGLMTALVTAVSPIALGNSLYLTQHATIEIFSALALLGLLVYLRTGKLVFAFLLGLAIGGGFSMHYQAINLFVYFPVAFFGAVWKRRSVLELIKLVAISALGAVIFPLPLFLWDASRNFKNLYELIYYFRVGQYFFWVSNRWLTYIGVFWPGFLGKVAGGNYYFGAFLGILFSVFAALRILRKKISVEVFAVLVILAIQMVMLRYFRGERFDGYLVYFHPVLFALVSWGLYELLKLNRILGGLTVLVILVASLKTNMPFYIWHNDVDQLYLISDIIRKRFPNETVVLYGRVRQNPNAIYSLSTVLDVTGVRGASSRAVGVCLYSFENCHTPGSSEITMGAFQNDIFSVADLGNVPVSELTKAKGWDPFSKLAVYDEVQNWWRKGL